jgi:hypothetical protein
LERVKWASRLSSLNKNSSPRKSKLLKRRVEVFSRLAKLFCEFAMGIFTGRNTKPLQRIAEGGGSGATAARANS